MSRRRDLTFALMSTLVLGGATLSACRGQRADADPETPDPGHVEDATDPAPQRPAGSCAQLGAAWNTADRQLARACEATEDCSLLWSDHNCYALRSTSDDVTGLEAIDAAMASKGCPEVECEPPPMRVCEDGTCQWDL